MPTLLSDTGLLTNMSALPVTKLNFGGLVHSVQSASFRLGALQCFGMVELEAAGSCADLKLAGVTRSGVYNVVRPGEQFYRVVQCDMEAAGYEEVPEEEQQPPLVSVCGEKFTFTSNSATIPYDSLFHSSTNIPGGPALNTETGVFTAPLAGVYSVTWALQSSDHAGDHWVDIYLRHNGINIGETRHDSYYSGSSGKVDDQGGRTVNLELAAADTLELWCDDCSAEIGYTTFCINLLQAV